MSDTKMTVKEASERMGASEQFIRIGLQQKLFPWGYAIRMSEGRFTYYINRKKFEQTEGK